MNKGRKCDEKMNGTCQGKNSDEMMNEMRKDSAEMMSSAHKDVESGEMMMNDMNKEKQSWT